MARISFARMFALPVLSAGVIGGAALGLAGAAHADDGSYTLQPDIVAVPTTYAAPATTWVPWGQYVTAADINVPQVDTTAHG